MTSKTDQNINIVREKIVSDRRLTIREVAGEVGLAFGTVQEILTENLAMRRISAKFVPKVLTEEQRQYRLQVCSDLIQTLETEPDFVQNIFTGDET